MKEPRDLQRGGTIKKKQCIFFALILIIVVGVVVLNDGNGEMIFQCTNDDGSTDKYILELSISRHQKKYLQIDSISFKKSE